MMGAKQPELVQEMELRPKVEPEPPAPQGDHVALMFERLAKDPGVDVEKLERLIAMQERILKHNAESAFNAAFAAMQPEIPVIAERGRTDKASYAELEDIVEAIRPILAKHGFALSHRTEWPDPSRVRIVGILTHREGHQRTSEFLSSADSSGSKNAIQALGSAVSYGRRYTTKDLLNIVTRREDDDGLVSESFKAPETPAGYDDWWADMTACSEEGWPKLSQAWGRSSQEYRAYTQRHNKVKWDGLKKKAQAIAPGAGR